ncbi:hypothetical protein GCM10010381_58640 [Streptomyces xantholiticus]|nr:hypothetical protein GCM10010381_58640 [Streptomyces xantholiticus]
MYVAVPSRISMKPRGRVPASTALSALAGPGCAALLPCAAAEGEADPGDEDDGDAVVVTGSPYTALTEARPPEPSSLVLSDELWSLIEPLLPEPGRKQVAGRPRVSDRQALRGILFVLHTGIQWEYLPQELGFGSGMTCWRSSAGVRAAAPALTPASNHR